MQIHLLKISIMPNPAVETDNKQHQARYYK